jgi:hypothetical protein
MDSALAGYIARTRFQEPPYTTSRELVAALRAAAPEYNAVLDDMFERIVLFDNRITAVTSEAQSDGSYRVRLTVESHKYIASQQGAEAETPVNDWIDIGVFAEKEPGGADPGKPLLVAKHHLTQASTVIELVVPALPVRAGIDPYNKLIDRNPDNNTMAVTNGRG